MGVLNWAKNKAKETVTNMKTERAYAKAEKLERREQYNRGYREGQFKRGQLEGAGGVAPVTVNQQRQQSSGRSGAKWQPNWKGAGDMFAGGLGGGGDPYFGGGQQAPRQPPPMQTTKISKTGVVTIQRPYERQQPMQAPHDPVADFWGTPGGSGVARPRRKGEREKDPSDFIL